MKSFILFLTTCLLIAGCQPTSSTLSQSDNHDTVIYFPANRYPQTAEHIQKAIAKGESDICTIDRNGAEERRDESLKGIPTKKGYDRDEWPMAVCMEGGKGADIEYVKPKDNRGAGGWIGNRLEGFPDGTKVKFILK